MGLIESMRLVDICRLFRHVREAGANKGLRVNGIQTWSGGASGDSWCCEMATMWLDLFFQGASPIPRLQACQDVYALAKRKGWVTSTPAVGDLFLYVDANDHAHHIGVVTGTNPLTGIAGNTSESGASSNGDGVFEHAINAHVFVHYPRHAE